MLNTLVHDKPVSVGSQWALYNPTVVVVYGYNGLPRTHLTLSLSFTGLGAVGILCHTILLKRKIP